MKHKIPYQIYGQQGPLYVLIYGYGGNPKQWSAVVEGLSKTNRVVVPQLNSIYMSKDPLFFTVQVELILKFIAENFASEIVNLVGVSYGGLLSWALSLQNPMLFSKVFLINPMLPAPLDHVKISELRFILRIPFNFQALSLLLATPMGKKFLSKTAMILGNESEDRAQRIQNLSGRKIFFITRLIHHFSWLIKNEDWRWWEKKSSSMQGKKCATELIISKDDPLFSVNSYEKFYSLHQFSNFHVLPSGGHLLPISQPQEVCALISSPVSRSSAEKITAA